MNTQKLFVGVTKDRELYFLEIEQPHEDHDYFSMSGFTVNPMTRQAAIDQVREQLEDGELWKQAVECGNTTLGKDDWIEYVLDTDGELAGFDNSLYPDEPDIDDEPYVFDSRSCGQHEEKPNDIIHYGIDRALFEQLLNIWQTKHMHHGEVSLPELPKQDIPALVADAVRWMKENEF